LVVAAVALALTVGPTLGLRLLETTVSDQIAGRVRIGGAAIVPWRGSVVLREVALLAPGEAGQVVLGIERVEAKVALRPLLDRELHVQELVLRAPTLDLDRVRDGSVNLLRALEPPPAAREAPATLEEPAPAEAPAIPAAPPRPGWRIALDEIRIEGGQVGFRDVAVRGSEVLDIEVERFEVERIASDSARYAEPMRVHVRARAEDAAIALDADVIQRDAGWAVTAGLHFENFPLRRARVYLPAGSWSDLVGRADGDVVTELGADSRARLYGSATFRDVRAQVNGLAEPGLAAGRVALEMRQIDLDARRAELGRLQAEDATLVVTPGAVAPVPALAFDAGGAGEGPPWTVTLARAELRDARLRVLAADGSPPHDVELEATLTDLASEPDAPGRIAGVAFTLRDGPGTVGFAGAGGFGPFSAAGALTLDAVDVARAAALLPPAARPEAGPRGIALSEGALFAALELGAGARAADGVEARGTVRLAGLKAAARVEGGPRVELGALELRIGALRWPGLFSTGLEGASGAPTLSLESVRVERPSVALTRDADGWVGLGPATDAEATAPESPPAAATGDATPRRVDVEVSQLDVTEGAFTFVDRTVTPFFTGRASAIALEARKIGWPWRGAEALRGSAELAHGGRVTLEGSGDAEGTTVVVRAGELPLPPWNPYVTPHGYSVRDGTLTLVSSLWTGAEGFDAKSWLIFHDLDLGGPSGDSLFQQEFGVSLGVALALLRDLRGDISIDVPFWLDREGFGIGVDEAVRSAVRQALTWAIASPLKLLGSVVPRGGRATRVPALEPIPFASGKLEIAGDAAERVEALAALLAASPGVRATLRGVVAEADAPEGELRALAAGRERSVRAWLATHHGVKDVALASDDESLPVEHGEPAVRVVFGSAK
jgi:hypothetical protein